MKTVDTMWNWSVQAQVTSCLFCRENSWLVWKPSPISELRIWPEIEVFLVASEGYFYTCRRAIWSRMFYIGYYRWWLTHCVIKFNTLVAVHMLEKLYELKCLILKSIVIELFLTIVTWLTIFHLKRSLEFYIAIKIT